MTQDSSQMQPNQTPPARRRKPLWPWVLLLVLTLCAIYAYMQVTHIIETIRHEVPPEVWDIIEWMLRQSGVIPDNGRPIPDYAAVLFQPARMA